jgi:bifunctional UDP-N-acetylglucosamine pyrophosphorylase/glucosamine-1-phosphate N-acetyltransferase
MPDKGNAIVVVLAAGKGVRMKSRTPKVLHPIGGRPMLLWSLAAAQAIEPERVLVVTDPRQDGVNAMIDGQGVTVSQREQLGTGHALAQVSPEHRTNGPVVVIYADTPLLRGETLARLLETHRQSSAAVTLLTAHLADPRGYGRIVRGRGGAFKAIVEEKDATPAERAIQEINSGVYCFTGAALWLALERLQNKNRAGEYYLTDVVGLIKGTVKTLAVDDPEEILGINDRKQLAQAEAIIRRRTLDQLMEAGVTVTDPQSTFVDATVSVGQDSTLRPFTVLAGATRIGKDCVIGPYTQIRDSTVEDGARVERAQVDQASVGPRAIVGPFALLRPGTRLDEGVKVGTHTEVKNSRIGPRTMVGHFSYIGDTIIGADTNIGAGTVTANWDGFDHNETQIGDRVRVGSDTILVAPVTVGDDAYTGAGSVITRDVPAGSLSVERGEQNIVEGWTERYRSKRRAAASKEVKQP